MSLMKLGYEEAVLEAHGGAWTAREIEQQPDTLILTQALLMARRREIDAFLRPLLSRANLRVILTGAGTSAFIGDSLAPWLAARLERRVESIPSTDLTCAPGDYFTPAAPTLLVSFGRSGASPESLAAIRLAEQDLVDVHHLIVTCNADGALAAFAKDAKNCLCLILPEATHDRGFAMTSSYSGMAFAALSALTGVVLMQSRVEPISRAVAGVIADYSATIKAAANVDFQRVAYLGSHVLKGMAREAALKLMELTNGAMVTQFDSPLGFRHGPKTFVNDKTLVFLFLSNDPYTRRYDLDLLSELRRDGEAGRVIVVGAQEGLDYDDQILVRGLESADDIDLLFPYIVAPQIFAFEQSMRRGLRPDQPNAKGSVNRVVQGVQIYERS